MSITVWGPYTIPPSASTVVPSDPPSAPCSADDAVYVGDKVSNVGRLLEGDSVETDGPVAGPEEAVGVAPEEDDG